MEKLCEEFFIIPIFGRPRYPQSQGIIERANQTLTRRLSKYLEGKGKRWLDIISKNIFLYLYFRSLNGRNKFGYSCLNWQMPN